jgi:hypothetical protein
MVVGVAGDVRPPIHEQDFLAGIAREPFGQDASGIACAHD